MKKLQSKDSKNLFIIEALGFIAAIASIIAFSMFWTILWVGILFITIDISLTTISAILILKTKWNNSKILKIKKWSGILGIFPLGWFSLLFFSIMSRIYLNQQQHNNNI